MKRYLTFDRFYVLISLWSCEKDHQQIPKSIEWVRNSVEYVALCKQTYNSAWLQLKERIPVDGDGYALVFDVDETVLDNSLFELEGIKSNLKYSPERWAHWVERREAVPITGVQKFLENVRSSFPKIQIAYITNRDGEGEVATKENLEKYDLFIDGDILMCRKEKADTKVVRRDELMKEQADVQISEKKEIIALFGDNLKDFYEVDASFGIDSLKENAASSDQWGVVYFVLPNPIYGSWEKLTNRIA